MAGRSLGAHQPARPATRTHEGLQGTGAMSKTSTQQKAVPKPKAAEPGLREGSTMWAAIEVLRGKRKLTTAGEICAVIHERNLAPGWEEFCVRAREHRYGTSF